MGALTRYGVPVFAGTDRAPSGTKRLIAVTFDDGFAAAVQNTLPILLEHGIPLTIFVPTSCIGQPCSWIVSGSNPNSEETILSSEEIRKLSTRGVVIGSHGVSHRSMTTLSERELWAELVESKDTLESITGRAVDLCSFPHGEYTSEIANLAKRAGYRHGFTIVPRFATTRANEFLRERINTSPADWRIEFWLKLRGAYCWLWPAQILKCKVHSLFAKV
jgi:peptidoglycan/xylan/chitin deacetylase (PgdA/CDA1 family)